MQTYHEMNAVIVELLRHSDNPAMRYAAARIEELESEAAAVKAARDALLKALIRVKTGTCFCDVGSNLSLRHTPECDYAMSVLAESEATP